MVPHAANLLLAAAYNLGHWAFSPGLSIKFSLSGKPLVPTKPRNTLQNAAGFKLPPNPPAHLRFCQNQLFRPCPHADSIIETAPQNLLLPIPNSEPQVLVQFKPFQQAAGVILPFSTLSQSAHFRFVVRNIFESCMPDSAIQLLAIFNY